MMDISLGKIFCRVFFILLIAVVVLGSRWFRANITATDGPKVFFWLRGHAARLAGITLVDTSGGIRFKRLKGRFIRTAVAVEEINLYVRVATIISIVILLLGILFIG